MKNLVKEAKSKRWMDVVIGLSFAIISFEVLKINTSDVSPKIDIAMNYIVIIMSCFFGFLLGLLVDLKLFEKVINRMREISKIRRIHHIRLIEKAIDDNNKEKAEELLFQFVNSKRKNINLCDHLSGAIRGKFYDKIELNLLDDK